MEVLPSDAIHDTSIPVDLVPAGGEGGVSASEAARILASYRNKRDDDTAAPEVAAAETASGDEPDNAAPREEATGEQTQADDQQETAPIEMPRSWAKDKAELWAKLDPALQEYLLEQDSTASKTVRQSQNEAAEARKAVDAERSQMEQARKQYEQALPVLLQTLQQQQQGEFADIKTMADVENLARTDWPRYALWDAQQKKIAAVHQEMQASQQRQEAEFRDKWSKFASDEDAKFLQAAPELTDKEKAQKVQDASVSYLRDIGFSDSDLSKLWNGEASVSLRDHRIQLLIRDAVGLKEARAALKTSQVRKAPAVQKPGSPVARARDGDVQLKNLTQQLENTGSVRDGVALLMARRAAR